jgi:hypothetical protein
MNTHPVYSKEGSVNILAKDYEEWVSFRNERREVNVKYILDNKTLIRSVNRIG